MLTASLWQLTAFAQPNLQGQWRTLPTLMPINPVHVALMRNGKVLVVSGSGNVATNTDYETAVWDPQSDSVTTQAVTWDMFCNGMVVLPDGRPFVIGGTLAYDAFRGSQRTSAYDPSSDQFVDLEDMAHGRWYPTATTLADGSVLVFSGLDENGPTNNTVEIYKLGSGWSQEYPANWTPPLYPRLHLLPNGNVFYSGPGSTSRIFDPANKSWSTVATTNYPGTRTYGSSVLLPLTPENNYHARVMILGGGNPATATTEIIDLSSSNPTWKPGAPMSQGRIEMNAVLLPNGKVLALGGSTNDEDQSTAGYNADLFSSDGLTMTPAGQEAYPRLYHSVALLLPDARVWVAGGNPARGAYEPHMEIYSPPYLFDSDGSAAPRPTISDTPSTIGYGVSFQVQTPDVQDIASVVLVRQGAATHAFDMDQRLVGLNFTAEADALNVTGPPSGGIAPPGYYMLFVLNSAGVPSTAKTVRVSPSVQSDFSLSASPSSQVVVANTSTSYTVTVKPGDGFTGTVAMSVSGLPTGTTGTFDPTTVSTSGSSTLTIKTSLSTPLGSYPLKITGTSGSVTRDVNVTLTVVGSPSLLN